MYSKEYQFISYNRFHFKSGASKQTIGSQQATAEY